MVQLEKVRKFILKKLKDELPAHLTYHSVDHVKDVYACCKSIGRSENVSGTDLKLLLTAALFHDAGFLVQAKDHEAISCNIAWEYLPDFGYTESQIKLICGMIMATKIPQTPHNKLEEILADADLDYLGRDDFYIIGEKLYQELLFMKVISTEDEWNNMQVSFLETHHYFTPTSIENRKPKKLQHLKEIKLKLNNE